MRIAVIGSGISGLICARLLSREHDVSVFEADSRIGGHTNTVSVELDGEQHEIDTGFIVYNERNYPVFTKILADLGVQTEPTSMSFSVRCDRTGLEYNGTSLNGVFAQRGNLVRPSFLRLLKDVLRFNRQGSEDLDRAPADQTVREYLDEHRYSTQFADQYLLPMGAAIWSCPVGDFARFPIRFILEFYANHGLLALRNRPVWRIIQGGSQRYVERLVEPFKERIRLNSAVTSVYRTPTHVCVEYVNGTDSFDEVIFACHSNQALRLLGDVDELEFELLTEFPYSASTAVLHTDESVLPRHRRAWAAWNYHIPQGSAGRPTVTYHMGILQHINSRRNFLVTLNEEDAINPELKLATFHYEHPVFTTQRASAQSRHSEVIRRRRTSFCGAYWRNGFHEDGIVSALAVCRKFGIDGWVNESRRSPVDTLETRSGVSGDV
jgi:uncharacterized protein